MISIPRECVYLPEQQVLTDALICPICYSIPVGNLFECKGCNYFYCEECEFNWCRQKGCAQGCFGKSWNFNCQNRVFNRIFGPMSVECPLCKQRMIGQDLQPHFETCKGLEPNYQLLAYDQDGTIKPLDKGIQLFINEKIIPKPGSRQVVNFNLFQYQYSNRRGSIVQLNVKTKKKRFIYSHKVRLPLKPVSWEAKTPNQDIALSQLVSNFIEDNQNRDFKLIIESDLIQFKNLSSGSIKLVKLM